MKRAKKGSLKKKHRKRKMLAKQLIRESKLAALTSIAILKEFEALRDDFEPPEAR